LLAGSAPRIFGRLRLAGAPEGERNKAPKPAVDGAVPNNIKEARMIRIPRILPAIVFALAASCYGSMASAQAPAKITDGMLTNAAGMTLYTFDKDADRNA
jgi:hypothetical protein